MILNSSFWSCLALAYNLKAEHCLHMTLYRNLQWWRKRMSLRRKRRMSWVMLRLMQSTCHRNVSTTVLNQRIRVSSIMRHFVTKQGAQDSSVSITLNQYCSIKSNKKQLPAAAASFFLWPLGFVTAVKVGLRHPDPVVETSSLSSVSPPDVWYRLTIPEEVIDRGCLSALQLEAITYAAQVITGNWLPIRNFLSFIHKKKRLKNASMVGCSTLTLLLLFHQNLLFENGV